MVAKEEEVKPPPEPPVQIESGKYPVPALPIVQKFLLLKFSQIQAMVAQVSLLLQLLITYKLILLSGRYLCSTAIISRYGRRQTSTHSKRVYI